MASLFASVTSISSTQVNKALLIWQELLAESFRVGTSSSNSPQPATHWSCWFRGSRTMENWRGSIDSQPARQHLMLSLFSVLRVIMSDTQGSPCLVCSMHCVTQPHPAAAGLASRQNENKRLTFVEGKVHVEKIEVCECLGGCHFFQCIGELFCSLNTRETKNSVKAQLWLSWDNSGRERNWSSTHHSTFLSPSHQQKTALHVKIYSCANGLGTYEKCYYSLGIKPV